MQFLRAFAQMAHFLRIIKRNETFFIIKTLWIYAD